MGSNVIIVGTLDTKGPEVAYLRDRISERGCETTVVDVGILGEPRGIDPDIDHETVARAGGHTIHEVREAGTRGRAVAMMRSAVETLMTSLHEAGRVDAAIGLGGAEGAVMGAAALSVLPIGVPKIVLSPIASGRHEFGPLVGTSDMMVVHTVVDILGLNPIATTVFDNVAAAAAAMAGVGSRLQPQGPDNRHVAVTMLGNTTMAVMALRDRLSEHGYEAVVFHSNGVGGPAMEKLAEAGQFCGIIDFTTNEVTDPLVGGIHDGGPMRLSVGARLGLPQVIVPGCIDFSVFASSQVPPALNGRPTYDHNPEYTLVRTPADEMAQIGKLFAERLSAATGRLVVAIPLGGLSIPNVPGGVFWDPEADEAFRSSLSEHLRADIPVETYEHHVNDPAFGEMVADLFVRLAADSRSTHTARETAND